MCGPADPAALAAMLDRSLLVGASLLTLAGLHVMIRPVLTGRTPRARRRAHPTEAW